MPRIFAPLGRRHRTDVLRHAATARRRATWPREQLEAYRDSRLRAIVRHAYRHVAFYRRLYDAHGVDVAAFRGARDLVRLPIVRKRDFQLAADSDRIVEGVAEAWLQRETTSGSLGEPLTSWRTWPEKLARHAHRARALNSFGLQAGERYVAVTLRHLHPPLKSALRWLIGRVGAPVPQLVSCRTLPADLARDLAAADPQVLTGYPRNLVDAAVHGDELDVARIKPRLTVVGGDTTTRSMRETLEQRFGTRVVQTYGSTELGLMAWSCMHGDDWHIGEDHCVVELLDDTDVAVDEGERGRVVATDLTRWAAPIIRYDHADSAIRGADACPCGAPFPSLRDVLGRRSDLFSLPKGRLYDPWDILQAVERGIPGVLRLRVEQFRRDRVTVFAELRQSAAADVGTRLAALVAREFGPDVDARLEIVDQLHADTRGKVRLIHSHLGNSYDPDDAET